MELSGKAVGALVLQSLAGAVVDVDVGYLGHGRVHRVREDHIAVVLAGDEHTFLLQVTDGVVAAPVAIGQPACLGAGGQGQKLVAHAHAEDGMVLS